MAAASAEGLSPARTMRIAESLYMDGYISYPRVDNTVYPSSLDLAETVQNLVGNPAYAPYCKELLAKGKLTATRGKKETTDHPPIYPTNSATPDDLPAAEYKLYNLIARRFLATLSEAAVVEGTKVGLEVGGEMFVGRGDVLVKQGFRAIYPYGLKKDEQMPALAEGQSIAFGVAWALGAHGEGMVCWPRYTTVEGTPITELMSEDDVEAVVERTVKGGAEVVAHLKTGSAYYAPGASIAKMVEAILTDSKEVMSVCSYIDGEYGIKDLYMNIPTRLGKNGVEEIVEFDLTDDELASLQASAESVRAGLANLPE
nr:DNA topoisomerase [Raoultibacter timonensis]